MHLSIHTEPPTTKVKDQFAWPVNEGNTLELSIRELIAALRKKEFGEAPSFSEADFRAQYTLRQAAKPLPESGDYVEQEGLPEVLWDAPVEPPVFENGAHFVLRKATDDELAAREAAAAAGDPAAGDAEPGAEEEGGPSGILPDEPPPPLGADQLRLQQQQEPGETGIGTSTQDIPRYNEVQVSGQLPLQHLKITALSWRGMQKQRGNGDLRSRPVSTATMCPSCGTPFAMNIPESVTQNKMMSNDMERELTDALEAQRSVMEGEKRMLEAEVTDLKTALNSINASLTRSREDGEELAQLAEQQRQWTSWLEGEIRQTKSEIASVGTDFDACLQSNQDLTSLVEHAIAKKVENKYWKPDHAASSRSAADGGYRGGLPSTGASPSGPAPLPPSPLHQPTYQPGGVAASSAKRDRFRDIVSQYYHRHNPSKLGLVDTLVDEYEGKERELLNLMARKYGDATILSYDALLDDPQAGQPPRMFDSVPRPPRKAPDAKIQSIMDSFLDKETASTLSTSGYSDLAYPTGAAQQQQPQHTSASRGLGGRHPSRQSSFGPEKVTFTLPTASSVYRPGAQPPPPYHDPPQSLQQELAMIAPNTLRQMSNGR